MKNHCIIVIVMIMVYGCTSTPKPIQYGADGCHYCSMTIVDNQHAAQFMTAKGRTYSFDATECMLNYLKEIDPSDVAVFRVNDYNAPGKLIDAAEATYLISENIPSPMGEFLTAFATQRDAFRAQATNQGEIFTWPELQKRFK